MDDQAALVAVLSATIAGGIRMVESIVAKMLPRKIQLSDDEHRWLSQLFEKSLKDDQLIKQLLHAAEDSARSSKRLAETLERVIYEMEVKKSGGNS